MISVQRETRPHWQDLLNKINLEVNKKTKMKYLLWTRQSGVGNDSGLLNVGSASIQL